MRKITPKQWDSLTAKSGRQVVRCYANVLKNGAATGRVPCGGTVALDTFEEIERTASLSIPQELDWLAVELQPVMEIDGEEYPLGVFLPSSPENSSTSPSTLTIMDGFQRVSMNPFLVAAACFRLFATPFRGTLMPMPSQGLSGSGL